MYQVFSQLLLLFILIFLGMLCKKVHVLSDAGDSAFSRFLVKVTIPASFIYSVLSREQGSSDALLPIILVCIASFIITFAFSLIFVRLLRWNVLYTLMLCFANHGFMGIPVISVMFGPQYVFHVSLFMMVFNLTLYTCGVALLSKDSSHSLKSLAGRMLNPPNIAAVIAILLFIFPLKLPDVIVSAFASVSSLTSPLAMIMIGSTLASVSAIDVLRSKELYLFAFIKLIVCPAVLYLVLMPFVHDIILLKIVTVLTAMPTAANVTMLCFEYGGDVQLSSRGIFISTLLSIISLSVIFAII